MQARARERYHLLSGKQQRLRSLWIDLILCQTPVEIIRAAHDLVGQAMTDLRQEGA